jgi:DNA-binding XRE family transcriptional regulator
MSGGGTGGEIGLAVAMLRMIRGWERADLVRAMGVSRSWIAEIERGRKRPSLRTLQRITGALGLPMSAVDEALVLVRGVRSMLTPGAARGAGDGGDGGRGGAVLRGGTAREAGLGWDETGLSGVLFELLGESLLPGRGRGARGRGGRAGGAGERDAGDGGAGAGEDGASDDGAGDTRGAAGEEGAAITAEAARRQAAALWTRLRRYARDERRALVREAPEFQTWALCERLCEESVEAERPAAALELAELAVEVAQLATPAALPCAPVVERSAGRAGGAAAAAPPRTLSPRRMDRWRDSLAGYAWAFVARARRLAGEPVRAEEAVARSRALWPGAGPGGVGELAGLRLVELAVSVREGSWG